VCYAGTVPFDLAPLFIQGGLRRMARSKQGTATFLTVAILLIAAVAIQPASAATTCGVSNNHTICVTLPGAALTGPQTVQVTNTSNSGAMFVYWVPNGKSETYLMESYAKDPITKDYSFTWPTQKYLDGSGVLRFRSGSATAAPVDVPVTISNGNVTDYQHNPSDWQSYLPGPWNGSVDPVVVAVGDGASDEATPDQLAASIAASNPSLFLFLGDIYEYGTHTENLNHYGVSALDSQSPTLWGKFANVTQPTTGNHEKSYVSDWTDYWHGRPTFTTFTFGGTLFIDLYSSGTQNFTSAEYDMVKSALANNPPACIVGFWHHPVLNGSTTNASKLPMWQLLANSGGDLVLNGHSHFMAEYQPLDANLQQGPSAHMVELISGAGGHKLTAGKSDPRQNFLKGKTAGAVYLTLNGAANGGTARSLSWQWKDVSGNVLHTGSTTC
jgi:Calcineurin-like phosphoesterase